MRIEQTIYVMRDSQKKIVLGASRRDHQGDLHGGAQGDRRDDRRAVHLFLFVKVRERWGEDPERYREMGLDYPKE